MEEKDQTVKKAGGGRRQAALTATLALLTAASVVTGSLFDSPAALLPDDGSAPSIVYQVNNGLDGAEDDDASASEDESEETRRRGGIRSMLRRRILALPLAVRLLVILPMWALGSAIIAAAGAAWGLISPALGHIAGFALLLALLAGCFVLAAKAMFPDLPVKKLLNRRSLVALLLGAAALALADAVLPAVWAGYEQVKSIVMAGGFFAALSCAAVPFALREQKRRLKSAGEAQAAAKEEAAVPKPPETLTFTDAGGTFTVTIPNRTV